MMSSKSSLSNISSFLLFSITIPLYFTSTISLMKSALHIFSSEPMVVEIETLDEVVGNDTNTAIDDVLFSTNENGD